MVSLPLMIRNNKMVHIRFLKQKLRNKPTNLKPFEPVVLTLGYTNSSQFRLKLVLEMKRKQNMHIWVQFLMGDMQRGTTKIWGVHRGTKF